MYNRAGVDQARAADDLPQSALRQRAVSGVLMAQAPAHPAASHAATAAQDLDAQVERMVQAAARTAEDVRAVAERNDVPGPHEPNLDEIVKGATTLKNTPRPAVGAQPEPRAVSPAPINPNLDAQVGAALKAPARATIDPPLSPATLGPRLHEASMADEGPQVPVTVAVDPGLSRPPVASEDEFADPAGELAQAAPRPAAEPAAARAAPVVPIVQADPETLSNGSAPASPVSDHSAPVAPSQPAPATTPPPAPSPPTSSKPAAPAVAVPAAAEPVVAAHVAPAQPKGPSPFKRLLAAVECAAEPLAMRLGALPRGLRDTIGWIGMGTLFWASVVWVYVLAFAPTGDLTDVDPRTYLQTPEAAGAHAAPGGGHGESKAESAHGEAAGTKKDAKKKDANGSASGGHGEAKKNPPQKAEKKAETKNAHAKSKGAHGDKKTADAGGH